MDVLIVDDPLAGVTPRQFEGLAAEIELHQIVLLRGESMVGKSASVANLSGIVIVDPALLPPAAPHRSLEAAVKQAGSDVRAVVLDGLERAPRSVVADTSWLNQWQQSMGLPIVVVMRDDLPRPAGLSVDMEIVVVVPATHDFLASTRRLAVQVSKTLSSATARFVTDVAVCAETLDGGCALALTDLRRELQVPRSYLEVVLAESTAAGFLRGADRGDDPVVLFPATSVMEYFLSRAVRGGTRAALTSTLAFESVAHYAAQQEDAAQVTRTMTWSVATAMAVAEDPSASKQIMIEVADRNPGVAAVAIRLLAAAEGSAVSDAGRRYVLARLGGSGDSELGRTASHLMFLYDARGDTEAAGSPSRLPRGLAVGPVTNSDYEAFVSAGGYDDRQWWTTRGWAWRTGDSAAIDNIVRHWSAYVSHLRSVGLERLRVERGWRPERNRFLVFMCGLESGALDEIVRRMMIRPMDRPAFRDVRFSHSSKPVVGISLYEAEAYCAWLASEAQRIVRLPTVEEWEEAFSLASAYPWGDEFSRDRANTLELGLGSTTPVGSFSSWFGRHDMAGNVWEWTAACLPEEPSAETTGKAFTGVEYQVVKGGSWDNVRSYAARNALDVDPPATFGTRLGFRVYYEP